MGRKYVKVEVSAAGRHLAGLIGLIDTGSDLTVIGSNVAKKLKLRPTLVEMEWSASDGDKRYSPIVELQVKAQDDKAAVQLDIVLVDDAPLDNESGEEVILGLDYLQRTKKILSFDD